MNSFWHLLEYSLKHFLGLLFWYFARYLLAYSFRQLARLSNSSMTNISWYRVIQKKLFHKREEKIQEKRKMILQRNENLVHVQQQYGVSFCKKNWFQIWIFLADMALLMSNFYDFDRDQISWKLAQREFFVLVFHCKNSFYSRQSR